MNRWNTLLPFLTVAILLAAGPAVAGTDAKCKTSGKSCCKKSSKATTGRALAPSRMKKASATKTAPGTASMRVVIDKNTGELRAPTAEEARILAARDAVNGQDMNESSEGLTVVQHENGMQSVDLEGRFMSSSVARIDSDGKVVTACVDSEKERAEFMKRKDKETPKRKLDVE
ncbi:MAG TPA: hypothetical protein VNM92_15015 [Thermoanaerobaculia bacterium]|nr:hypothetical protein [Thermoanaerobaculia bacterium]